MSEFSLGILGYNRNQVDRELSENKSLISELEARIKELENDLEEYRTIESALKKSLVDARVKANEIIDESNQQAEEIIKTTNSQAIQFKENLSQQGNLLIQSGTSLKDQLELMKGDMRDMVARFSQMLDETDLDNIFPSESSAQMVESIELFENSSLGQESKVANKPENTLTEEEKTNLQKLIHEVISNEANKQVDKSASEVEKAVDLRVLKSN